MAADGDVTVDSSLAAAREGISMAVGLAVLATVAAARTRAVVGPAAAALVGGYQLSYWIAVGVVACDATAHH